MAYGFVITVDGRNLLAKLIAGEQLKITRIMVGKGEFAEGQDPAYFTDLIQPVAQATSTKPVTRNETVSFVVEYRSDLNGGLKEGFWLKEFGVFAQDGENEILLYYATLADFPQYVTAYKHGAIDIRRYPVSIAVSDKINVTLQYPMVAFVTEESFRKLLEVETIPFLEQMIEKSSIQKDIVIPSTGWLNGAVGGGRYIDITQDFITEKMIPFVSIFPEDMTVARICGMSTAAETKNKILRLYAEKAPSREINASLLLLRTSSGTARQDYLEYIQNLTNFSKNSPTS